MSLLESKSNEECQKIIDGYKERLMQVFGVEKIEPDMVAGQIQDQFEKKLAEEFQQSFGDLNGPTLKTCLGILAKEAKESKPRIITGKK